MAVPEPHTTVVVISRNRRADLLTSLPRHEAPVVLVDNASTDGSHEVVRGLRDDLRLIRLPRNRGAYGRTLGARASETHLVAFADDDSWWAPGALDRAAALFDRHPRLGLIAGSVLVGPEERPDPFNEVLASSPLPSAPDAPGPELLGFVGCAAIARRDALLQVGGFDDVVRFPGEEERVALDLYDAGWQLCYVPDVVAHHHPSPRRTSNERRQIAMARSRILTAVMRLPWSEVAREVTTALGSAVGRRGLIDALPRVPRAVRSRRRLSPRTLHARALLRTDQAGGSDA